jgi:antirestriction protein ArdC
MNTTRSLDDLLTTLGDKLAEPGHNLMPVLGLMSRFGHYSLSNQLLIYIQRPSATRVLGFHGWRKAGYAVRKGEKGIAIYAPMRFRDSDESNNDTTTDTTTPRVFFRVAYVFDISQVEPLNGTTPVMPDTSTTPVAPLACLEALKAFIAAEGYTLAYEHLPRGHYGRTDGRTITCALGLAPYIEFGTLVHEATHALLHFTGERPDFTTCETEAEAVAYLVCEQLQLADTELSIDYIRAYRGTKDTLHNSLERIRATAQRLAAVLIPEASA